MRSAFALSTLRGRVLKIGLFFCILLSATTTLFYMNLSDVSLYGRSHNYISKKDHNNTYLKYSVYSSNCVIPNPDPFDPSITEFLSVVNFSGCGLPADLTYQVDNELHVNLSVAQNYHKGNFLDCCYRSFARSGVNDVDIKIGSYETCFRVKTLVSDEYIRVTCFNTMKKVIYQNLHAFVQAQPGITERNERFQRHLARTDPVEKLNVVIVGIDSVSRLRFLRAFPKTQQFLIRDLDGIEFQGYNKVADNTFVNIIPMFTGRYVAEFNRKSLGFLDDFPLIWKNFSERGYTTLFAEDAPRIAIFNFAKKGFKKQPTDYYYRPFSLVVDTLTKWRDASPFKCLGGRTEVDLNLQFMSDFLKLHQKSPHFAFSFITRATHATIATANYLDESHLSFLKTVKQLQLLNNTVLIYLSDHGMRYNGIVETQIGRLEERLPFFSIVFPKWFQKKYPDIMRNVRQNAHRLTTPFDVHKTLLDIMDFDVKSGTRLGRGRGISLLNEIPAARSCNDAEIPPHWCSCRIGLLKNVDPTSKNVIRAALAATRFLNYRIRNHDKLCFPLSLSSVANAMVLSESKGGSITVAYVLIIMTTPGSGRFSMTVYENDRGTFEVEREISRINTFGESSRCINQAPLKKICYCRDFHKKTVVKILKRNRELRRRLDKTKRIKTVSNHL